MNGTALNFMGDLVARSQERSFQKKVAQMLAAGDCIGASTFAHTHGHEAMSDQILRSCQFHKPALGTSGTLTPGQPANTNGNAQPGGSQQLPAAFDLWCEGTKSRVDGTGIKESHYEHAFRVDLAAGRYCDGDCSMTRAIMRIEPTKITFYGSDQPGLSGSWSELSVNRESGELADEFMGVNSWTTTNAKCERRPFSGFPQPKF
ncbi:MAG: hypothetical protein K2Q09_04280 [Phycisphaerales bacterium]|nr:hypothetical protein [Phycisphaerales bacterium]